MKARNKIPVHETWNLRTRRSFIIANRASLVYCRNTGRLRRHNLRSRVSFDLSAKHATGRMQPIDSPPDNLGPGLRKEFRVPSSRPLVIALSVDARLAPAACIIKLPACRNADEAYLREPRAYTKKHTRVHITCTQLRFHIDTRTHFSG